MDFRAQLRSVSLKATPKRIAILDILEHSKKPLTAEGVHKALRGKLIDQATIYRTLKDLTAKNILRQIDFQHGHAHYELASGPDHHHLVCMRCGRVEDFTGCDFKDIKARALRQTRHFKKVANHTLELFGICTSCEKK